MDFFQEGLSFLHQKFVLKAEDVVEVTLDAPANVLLLDPVNFSNYNQNAAYRYHGGYAKTSPVRLSPPHPGTWHVVVNLGGYPGRVRAGVRVIREGVPSIA
jgi:hypothetical protein